MPEYRMKLPQVGARLERVYRQQIIRSTAGGVIWGGLLVA